MKHTRRSSICLVVLLISACGNEASPTHATSPTQAGVALVDETEDRRAALGVVLLAKARALAPAYPDLQLVNLRYADDLTLICGYMVASGETPLLFVSSDSTPDTIDRPIGMANLTQSGDWSDPRQEAGQARMARQCASMDLIPTVPNIPVMTDPARPASP